MIDRICAVCGKTFKTYKCWAKRKNGSSFCSRECQYVGKSKKPPTFITAVCKFCGKEFRRTVSNAGKLAYCSNKCRFSGVGLELSGENHWTAKKDHPISGSAHHNWKGGKSKGRGKTKGVIFRAKKEVGKCERCGSTSDLQGHHKKSFAANVEMRAARENIEILCANCHAVEHPRMAPMISRPRLKTGTILACVVCGKEYYRPQSLVYKSRYCSKECKWVFQKGNKPIWVRRTG